MGKVTIQMIGSQKNKSAKVYLSLACLVALCCSTGCNNKNAASDTKTAQETQAFRGHQPTQQQLQAAMPKANQPAQELGQTAPAKP